ncbi:sodium:proton antiporter [Hoyosella rhizosphaerae]|uniref:NADH:quinone oxidoreductase/Mrp antiporter transmembrane domain-containing protein n=1 Tax=Hoyosella rhizosphaerae TaxID=1755582 RepID=A0A916XCA7_9ACTN|nr:proton-conducting transporter membrane subunit [Hoyosella rhizosphaerae]MBN4926205.1 sodium:proton antiporter [Hoyosella rhizosphaerae]GGC61265.1 hypothetical protein GCM10011410_12160 [Hoyosella rhizosphaerae]
MPDLLPMLVLLPLVVLPVVALLTLSGHVVAARAVAIAATGGVTVLAFVVAVTVSTSGPLQLALGGWEPPVAIVLAADGFSAAMLVLTGVVGILVAIYGSASQTLTGGPWFWSLWLLLLAGLNAVYVSADLFNTYVALELVTVAGVALVALGGGAAQRAALRYLLIAVLGSLLFLLGIAFVYAETGTLTLVQAGLRIDGGTTLFVALGAMTLGLAVKTALFPLHSWLPPAHAGAPAAVSPLMSALVIKASFFVAVRMWTVLAGESAPVMLANAVGAVGAVGTVWGGILALRQTKLKKVIAYSTVAQVGYLFLLFPLVVAGGPNAAALAWQGVLLIAVAHGLAKASMFMAAGSLAYAYGSDELDVLRGTASRLPTASMAIAIAGVSLAGLPPTLAFVGKWQVLRASLESGQWWWVPVLLVGGLLTFAYIGRVLAILLDSHGDDDRGGNDGERTNQVAVRVPVRMQWTALVLAVATIVLGVRSLEVADLLHVTLMGGEQ